ncbi:MAG: hypothetical protein RL087_954 [Pseudomonadota bacterium]
MAVYSMTGYATVQSEGQPRHGLELRSVNSRFLDLALKLPEEWRAHEPALREAISARCRLGKVEVRAFFEARADLALGDASPALLQRLLSLQDQIRAWMPTARELSVADVLKLASGSAAPAAPDAAALAALARRAIDGLLEARQREGERLATMLRGHVKQLRALAAQAAPLVPQLVAQQRERFLERWNEALGAGADAGAAVPSDAARDRALAEATAFAIRIDVAEELTRLDAHLDEIDRLLAKGGEIGKRLDFLIQELHREANTLGSKSAALELTRISVDMKVLIEQMREQVQNIE